MKIVIFDLDDTLFDTTGQLKGSCEHIANIRPFKDTHTILGLPGIPKFLVTAGNFEVQNTKISILGIRKYFESIEICSVSTMKLNVFGRFHHQFPPSAYDIIVVGDRIDREIEYGNTLGFTTIRLLHGKYSSLFPVQASQIPTHSISSLTELIPLLRNE